MKILASTLFLALALQAPGTTPAQPFPNHEEPASGWYCHPAEDATDVSTDAHACDCLGMIDEPICKAPATDEDGTPTEVPMTNDNSKCKVYCHKDHCTCMRQCKTT